MAAAKLVAVVGSLRIGGDERVGDRDGRADAVGEHCLQRVAGGRNSADRQGRAGATGPTSAGSSSVASSVFPVPGT